jgi:hypothetical protein
LSDVLKKSPSAWRKNILENLPTFGSIAPITCKNTTYGVMENLFDVLLAQQIIGIIRLPKKVSQLYLRFNHLKDSNFFKPA